MRTYFILIPLLGVGCVFPLGAQADWVRRSLVMPVAVEFDSNPTMVSGSSQGIFRTRIAPKHSLTREVDSDEYSFSLGAMIERSDRPALSRDRNDPNVALGWRHGMPTGEISLSAAADRRSTRAMEFSENGLIAADRTQTTKSLSGVWKNALTEKMSFYLTEDYKNVVNEKGQTTGPGLADYSMITSGAMLNYALDELSDAFVSVNASQYHSENIGVTSDTYGSMLGYKRKFSENFDWMFQAGSIRTTGSSSGKDWQGNWRLNYTGERFGGGFDIGRSVSPSSVSAGFLSKDQAKFQMSYALAEKAKVGVDVSVVRTNVVPKTDSGTHGVSYSQEISPFWGVNFRYQQKNIDRTTGSVSANIIGLTFICTHPDF